MVDRYLNATEDSGKEHGEVLDVVTKEYAGITMQQLNDIWARLVCKMKRSGLQVANTDHALEGALNIRCVFRVAVFSISLLDFKRNEWHPRRQL